MSIIPDNGCLHRVPSADEAMLTFVDMRTKRLLCLTLQCYCGGGGGRTVDTYDSRTIPYHTIWVVDSSWPRFATTSAEANSVLTRCLCHAVMGRKGGEYRVFQKKVAPKTFWNIFTTVKSFCVKFCKIYWKFISTYIYQFL